MLETPVQNDAAARNKKMVGTASSAWLGLKMAAATLTAPRPQSKMVLLPERQTKWWAPLQRREIGRPDQSAHLRHSTLMPSMGQRLPKAPDLSLRHCGAIRCRRLHPWVQALRSRRYWRARMRWCWQAIQLTSSLAPTPAAEFPGPDPPRRDRSRRPCLTERGGAGPPGTQMRHTRLCS